MFQATNSPILRGNFHCIYSFLYNAPTLLPTGDTVEMELHEFHLNRVTSWQQCRYIVLRAVYKSKVFLRMGEFVA
jgi:hypothetical protein